eukprot:20657_5
MLGRMVVRNTQPMSLTSCFAASCAPLAPGTYRREYQFFSRKIATRPERRQPGKKNSRQARGGGTNAAHAARLVACCLLV